MTSATDERISIDDVTGSVTIGGVVFLYGTLSVPPDLLTRLQALGWCYQGEVGNWTDWVVVSRAG